MGYMHHWRFIHCDAQFMGCPMPSGVIITRKKNIEKVSQDIAYLNSVDTTIMGSRNGQVCLVRMDEAVLFFVRMLVQLVMYCLAGPYILVVHHQAKRRCRL